MKATPVLLLILDGFGHREQTDNNAVALAHKPNLDTLWNEHPHTLINASESFVGLPSGQMGNSEVGHMNIGAGRVVYQDLVRINKAIQENELDDNPVLGAAFEYALKNKKKVHFIGLLSDGGVHSHIDHLKGLIFLQKEALQ